MLPSPHRLRLRRHFDVATRRGRRAGSTTMQVHLALTAADHPAPDPTSPDPPATDPGPARVGFVVSRACGPAVRRNRIRRRLRHLVADRMARLPAGGLLVVRALPAAGGADFDKLGADLDRCLDRLLAARRAGAGS